LFRERPRNGSLFYQITAGIIGKLNNLNPGARKKLVWIFVEKEKANIARNLMLVYRSNDS
jgi:hypothetical protein